MYSACLFVPLHCKSDAIVAQLVEHWLPKPRVAGSSPVYRSGKIKNREDSSSLFLFALYYWRSAERLDCRFKGSNLALCIGKFLALQLNNLSRSILHEALVL